MKKPSGEFWFSFLADERGSTPWNWRSSILKGSTLTEVWSWRSSELTEVPYPLTETKRESLEFRGLRSFKETDRKKTIYGHYMVTIWSLYTIQCIVMVFFRNLFARESTKKSRISPKWLAEKTKRHLAFPKNLLSRCGYSKRMFERNFDRGELQRREGSQRNFYRE